LQVKNDSAITAIAEKKMSLVVVIKQVLSLTGTATATNVNDQAGTLWIGSYINVFG